MPHKGFLCVLILAHPTRGPCLLFAGGSRTKQPKRKGKSGQAESNLNGPALASENVAVLESHEGGVAEMLSADRSLGLDCCASEPLGRCAVHPHTTFVVVL